MKAVVYETYGSPDVLRFTELEKPIPKDDQALIKVHAVSINGSDKENLVGRPMYARMGGLFKPRNKILGSDIAGRVEAVGKDHTGFKLGDEVFGELPGYHGGFAEYVCTQGKTLALKPSSLTFEQAAAIPQGGVIALNGIQQGKVQAGQKVLINGAAGSGGSFAVQLAKLYGAEVTGVDNAVKQDFMHSLGADHTIDYSKEDFTKGNKKYDLILDLVAYKSVFAYQRALNPEGTYFCVGGSVGVILQVLFLGALLSRTTQRTIRLLTVPQNREDLLAITELCKAGKIFPAIDKQYSLNEVPEALRYVVEGKAKGKVVITLANDES